MGSFQHPPPATLSVWSSSPSLPTNFGQQSPVSLHQGNSGGVETLPTISEDTVDYNDGIISLERILHGSDQRTTIMTRNIPRFLNCNQVIEVLNRTSRGAYDFLFEGHRASISVTHLSTLWILCILFAPGCQSAEEPVKFCHAVVQGKKDLVNSCHQSSVMTRPPEEQPKVFFTSGRFAGSQAPFPRPDAARSLRGALTSTTQQGQDTVAPGRHTRNRLNVHQSSQMILSRASDRIPRYPAAGSLPQSITADFSTTREGNATMRPSVGRSLPGHTRFDPPLAGAERDPLPSTAQSLFQNGASASQTVAPASPSGGLVALARLGYRSWGRHIRSWAQRRRAQRSSSTEKDTPSTREGK
ncbi:RNA recognition motif 2 [Penicillium bovifimosum]|uniref:RNA recognition motif 2 n=1 Tax=Penicillium bovifimosum TaxID=126998 RepID=A0A9W9L663_9EURO|nr:RNA recognition motif 2 [Penicillium bovifimosum]KAJ5139034.1 RNA recognition motif 2 [Penicillium bovifimosum]